MSSHRAALEMLQDKIDETRNELAEAERTRDQAENNLMRRQQDVDLIKAQLDALQQSHGVLTHDANGAHVQVYPS